jgi:hypothetical protein
MKWTHGFAAVALALLSACAHERKVDAYLPITRMELPEAGDRAFTGGVGSVGLARLRLTEDQTAQAPDTTQPDIQQGVGALTRFDASPTPMLSLGARVYGKGGGGQVKLMPLQPALEGTPFALAFTAGYSESREDFDEDGEWFDFCFFWCEDEEDPTAHTHVRQRLVDYAAIVGVRIAPAWMVFGGPYRSHTHYGGHHRSNGGPETQFADEATASGGNLGVAWTLGRWGRVIGEVSGADVRAHASRERVWMPSLAYQIDFGSTLRPIVPEREEPVEVVPLEPVKL